MGNVIDLGVEVLRTDINNGLTLMIIILGLGLVGIVIAFVFNQRGNNKTTEKSSESLATVIKSSSDVTLKVMAYIERNTDVLHTQTNKLTNIDDSIKGGFSGVQHTLTKIEKDRVVSQKEVIDEAVEKTKQSLSKLEEHLINQLMPLSSALATLRETIQSMSTNTMAQHTAVVQALQAIANAQAQIIQTAEKANEMPKPVTNGSLITSRSFVEDAPKPTVTSTKPINETLLIQTRNED
jgi:hypothetical protein